MRAWILVAALLTTPALAADAPSSIRNAKVEVASGAPAAVFSRIGRGDTGEWLGWSVPGIPSAETACCTRSKASASGDDEDAIPTVAPTSNNRPSITDQECSNGSTRDRHGARHRPNRARESQ